MSISYSLIVAMSENRVIGRDDTLPWHLPADLKHFRDTTMGHPSGMGRKNQEGMGRPLPGRQNIVLTRQEDYAADGCTVIHEPDQLEAVVPDGSEVMIIGGESFYGQMLPHSDRLYLTLVHAAVAGDAWFPQFDWSQWRELERSDCNADDNNPYSYSFLILQRRC